MKKTGTVRVICGIAALLVLLGCAAALWAARNTFTYSNLADAKSRQTAQQLLRGQGVGEESLERFFEQVDAFNAVPYAGLVESGWKKALAPFFAYDDAAGFSHLDHQQTDERVGCRAAAFLLMRDVIAFTEPESGTASAGRKDEMQTQRLFSQREQENYDRLYADVAYHGGETAEELAAQLTDYWQQAGIAFPSGEIQLVTAYGVASDIFQNFHTAVAVDTEDGVWLIEKADPIHPFQLSHFTTQAQLLSYMKHRVREAKCAAVFSNDTCLWMK